MLISPSHSWTDTAGSRWGPGYDLRLPAAGTLGAHRTVEAMKHAFALRMNLGDPGPNRTQPFVNVTDVLAATLSRPFAESLRCGSGLEKTPSRLHGSDIRV